MDADGARCIIFTLSISALVSIAISVFMFVHNFSGESSLHVVNASLTQFNLTTTTSNNILLYNLTLDAKLRNHSKTTRVRFRSVRTASIYKSERFALITLPHFYMGHENTTILHLLFQGEALVKFTESALKRFNEDQRLGNFGITIAFYFKLTEEFGGLNFRHASTMLCDLKLPLESYNGISTVGGFKTEECYLEGDR